MDKERQYRVLVADSMSEAGLAPLLQAPDVIVDQRSIQETDDLAQYDALLIRSGTTVTEEVLLKMPNVKIIARAGVGVDNVDVQAATKHGVVVINAPDGNTISTAEHTFAMMCSLLRNIPQANASLKDGKWERKLYQGAELNKKKLGIIGFGRIGTQLARRAKAFDMQVVVYDPFLTVERAEKLGIQKADLHDVLRQSDIITVHTPLTKETKGLLNMETIPLTKKGVYLINCARGGIIDEKALYHFLENGHVAGAALDVFTEEPVTDQALIEHANVVATPHIAASTKEAQLNVASQVAEEVLAFLQGEPARNSINLPTLSKELYEKIKPQYELAKTMGSLLSQLMRIPVQEINVYYSGSTTQGDTSILTRSLMAGFLQPRVDAAVNDVNASLIARERGINYGEKQLTDHFGYENLIHAVAVGEERSFEIKATYIKDYGPRIVSLNEFSVDIVAQGHILYIQHFDRPGVIGKMGQLLAQHDVNIATMQVGRKSVGGEAIMLVNVDKHVEDGIVEELVKFDEIKLVHVIDL
ncbi:MULTISPECIES: phosphoglycerate dehydrogenase [Shouchella]|uniref:D-3-phosphoglycerate dehydrogenase n=2 Tax=Shouchella TaxID=2893057 RepID=A0ABY7WA64_9BACI|nr:MULTISPECIES: phosphoglycerate dehydrogenase [Shouchella]MED4127116.1 phosphoglycerate dehydrogenase [Shouchella miscanthi]WDF03600.1 phosphoglycerate dehydrogenase [Shouchella hunanensis]